MVERLEGRLEKLKNELLEIQQEKELQALEEKRKAQEEENKRKEEVKRKSLEEKVVQTRNLNANQSHPQYAPTAAPLPPKTTAIHPEPSATTPFIPMQQQYIQSVSPPQKRKRAHKPLIMRAYDYLKPVTDKIASYQKSFSSLRDTMSWYMPSIKRKARNALGVAALVGVSAAVALSPWYMKSERQQQLPVDTVPVNSTIQENKPRERTPQQNMQNHAPNNQYTAPQASKQDDSNMTSPDSVKSEEYQPAQPSSATPQPSTSYPDRTFLTRFYQEQCDIPDITMSRTRTEVMPTYALARTPNIRFYPLVECVAIPLLLEPSARRGSIDNLANQYAQHQEQVATHPVVLAAAQNPSVEGYFENVCPSEFRSSSSRARTVNQLPDTERFCVMLSQYVDASALQTRQAQDKYRWYQRVQNPTNR